MKRLLIIAALALVSVPAALAVPPGTSQDASQDCKAQRRAMGVAGFQSVYAPSGKPRAAMDACLAKQGLVASTEAKNAAHACKAERDSLGLEEFTKKYGTNEGNGKGAGKNAFGKCVSQKAAEADVEHQTTTLNAAKTCKAERASLGATAFTDKYGTTKNAFGKCVSKNGQPTSS
jgi:hypothetical protein